MEDNGTLYTFEIEALGIDPTLISESFLISCGIINSVDQINRKESSFSPLVVNVEVLNEDDDELLINVTKTGVKLSSENADWLINSLELVIGAFKSPLYEDGALNIVHHIKGNRSFPQDVLDSLSAVPAIGQLNAIQFVKDLFLITVYSCQRNTVHIGLEYEDNFKQGLNMKMLVETKDAANLVLQDTLNSIKSLNLPT